MTARMSSKIEVFNAHLSAMEMSFKNQEAMVLSHNATVKEHTALLAEITKTLTLV